MKNNLTVGDVLSPKHLSSIEQAFKIGKDTPLNKANEMMTPTVVALEKGTIELQRILSNIRYHLHQQRKDNIHETNEKLH